MIITPRTARWILKNGKEAAAWLALALAFVLWIACVLYWLPHRNEPACNGLVTLAAAGALLGLVPATVCVIGLGALGIEEILERATIALITRAEMPDPPKHTRSAPRSHSPQGQLSDAAADGGELSTCDKS